jgi:riboflavin synthase
MFTGIIEAMGRIDAVSRIPGGARLRVRCRGYGAGLALGESVSVDGACLTVMRRGKDHFEAEVSPETMRRTTLGGARAGRKVNLERPLAAAGRLGGHFVQGHVDATGRIRSVRRAEAFVEMAVGYPASLKGLIVEKGSVAVNGVSLTVASITRAAFGVALIPHTLETTNLSALRAGDEVNLETDILAKYVRALLKS